MGNMDQNPIKKKRFYLEIKNSPHITQTITEYITQFGGTIEEFLNCNVHYVVTNRPKEEWPKKSELPTTPTTASKTTSNGAQPQTSTPIMFNQKGAFSRASKMLQSTQQTAVPKVNTTSKDPLQMARNFNKKILHTNDLIDFIRNHKWTDKESMAAAGNINNKLNDAMKKHQKNHHDLERNSRRLLPPYIKVVDNSFRYKTNFKELAEWPEINYEYQVELCPFYKPRRTSISANASQVSNKSLAVAANGRLNDKFQTVLTTPILTTPNIFNTNTNTTNTNNSVATQKTANTTTTTSKRKHMTFCEICHKEFDDFEKHLTDDRHQTFLNNNENFTELFSVIKSLPPFLSAVGSNSQRSSTSSSARSSGGKSFADLTNFIFDSPANHNSNSNTTNSSNVHQQNQNSPQNPLTPFHQHHNNAKTPQSQSKAIKQTNSNVSATPETPRRLPSPLTHLKSIQLNSSWDSKHSAFMPIHELINNDPAPGNDNSLTVSVGQDS